MGVSMYESKEIPIEKMCIKSSYEVEGMGVSMYESKEIPIEKMCIKSSYEVEKGMGVSFKKVNFGDFVPKF